MEIPLGKMQVSLLFAEDIGSFSSFICTVFLLDMVISKACYYCLKGLSAKRQTQHVFL